MNTIKQGSTGQTVKEIQEVLTQLGYYKGELDSIFGPKLHSAVVQYQQDNSLTADGIIGAKTAAHLGVKLGLTESDEFKLTDQCKKRLKDIHPDLVKIVERAIKLSNVEFRVGEGLRTLARQKELMKQGATQTLNSRHLTGHAVDLHAYPKGTLSWEWKHYYQIEEAMKQAASELGLSSALEWGGDWKSFKDGPHWQLSWKKYPK